MKKLRTFPLRSMNAYCNVYDDGMFVPGEDWKMPTHKSVAQAIIDVAPCVPGTATIYVRETSGYCIAKSHVRPFMAVVEGRTHVDANVASILREEALQCDVHREGPHVWISVTVKERFN